MGQELNDQDKDWLQKMLALSHVPRWVVIDVERKQSVADHCFRTMAFTLQLSSYIEYIWPKVGLDRMKLMFSSLTHDIDEAETGDMPHPFKHKMKRFITLEQWFNIWPEQRNKTDGIEGRIVAVADRIEGYTFLWRYGVQSEATQRYMRNLVTQAVGDLSLHMYKDHETMVMAGAEDYNTVFESEQSLNRNLLCYVEALIDTGCHYE